jgi:hypothetical protein
VSVGSAKRNSAGALSRPPSSSGLPSATIRPEAITATRSARACASSMKWVVSTTVRPASHNARIVAHERRRADGSKPVVGSSRNSTSGSPTSPTARSSRRRWPPESADTRTRSRSSSPTSSSSSPARRGRGYQRACMRRTSPTVSMPGSDVSCSTTPMRARNARSARAGSNPRTRTVPDVAWRWPSRISVVVVLPAPFGPSRQKTSPGATVNETPRTASWSPYDRRRSRTSMAGVMDGNAACRGGAAVEAGVRTSP